jgi:dTDP-glucose pyrophosphorylase
MVHLTDPKVASDAQSLVFYAQAIAQAARQLSEAPKGAVELAQVKSYYDEKSQTLKDILGRLDAEVA